MTSQTFTASAQHPLLHKLRLPRNPYSKTDEPAWHDAYKTALTVQRHDRLRGRVLGYLLIEALNKDARNYIACKISDCGGDNEQLHSLAQVYIDSFIWYFFRPSPENFSSDESESESDEPAPKRQKILISKSGVVVPPTNGDSATRQALDRDNYRCMASGLYEVHTQGKGKISDIPPRQGTITRATYIIPAPPKNSRHAEINETETRTIFKSYGGIDLLTELHGPLIHRLANILTLSLDFAAIFEALCLWFQEVPDAPEPNTYSICSHHEGILRNFPSRTVTFTAKHMFELPDPRYLRLHAAVCRITHKAGLIEYFTKVRGIML